MKYITPITKLISDIPEVNVYIKREDLLPFSFGGNKVRIAQEYYADMDAKGKNCMVGYGNSRSNLCRVLSNLSSSRGEVCYIISPDDEDGKRVETSNSKMVDTCGSIVRTCSKENVAEIVEKVLLECEHKGFRPYYTNGNKFGQGNEAVPVRAYVKAYREIQEQSMAMGITFDYIFLASGTGMTQAGLLAGKMLNGGKENIVGISVAKSKKQVEEAIEKYLNANASEMDSAFFNNTNKTCIEVNDEYLHGGYGKYSHTIVKEIHKMRKENGIGLDPIYTGKAYYGMKEYLRKKCAKGVNILFIHTGGTPLFFDMLNSGMDIGEKVTKLSNTFDNHKKLADFLTKHSSEFAVPLLERIVPMEYSEKILSSGYVLVTCDRYDNIQGAICGYANDYDKLQAYGSIFVISPKVRGTGTAKRLFEEQKRLCKKMGMKTIGFTTHRNNRAAIAFYLKRNVPIRKENCTDELIYFEMTI